jgi:cardiolipin synthase
LTASRARGRVRGSLGPPVLTRHPAVPCPDVDHAIVRRPFNLPNILTYGRIVAACPWWWRCLFWPDETGCAGRRSGCSRVAASPISSTAISPACGRQQSSLGRMLDPIADKLLVGAVLLMLAGDHSFVASTCGRIVILCREILVSGLREFLAEVRVSVPVSWLAKWKTTAQIVSLGFLIAGPAGDAGGAGHDP